MPDWPVWGSFNLKSKAADPEIRDSWLKWVIPTLDIQGVGLERSGQRLEIEGLRSSPSMKVGAKSQSAGLGHAGQKSAQHTRVQHASS